jgi:hypothetical protein
MGGIDFDAWSTPRFNRHVCARRYNDRSELDPEEIIADPWIIPPDGRVILSLAEGAQTTRRVLGRLLKEYRKGHVQQACAIVSHQEICRTAPWIWDFPICIPFRRLGYRYWDEELEQLRTSSAAQWSVVIYFPPTEIADEYHNGITRFHLAFSPLGRVIFSEYCGDRRWRQDYRRDLGREFSEAV